MSTIKNKKKDSWKPLNKSNGVVMAKHFADTYVGLANTVLDKMKEQVLNMAELGHELGNRRLNQTNKNSEKIKEAIDFNEKRTKGGTLSIELPKSLKDKLTKSRMAKR